MTAQHIDDGGKHIEELDRRLHDLRDAFADLGSCGDFEELFKIIHNPGWTTLIDVLFMNVVVDAAGRAADDARRLRSALLEGARAVANASVPSA
jgi:hypothetical protein